VKKLWIEKAEIRKLGENKYFGPIGSAKILIGLKYSGDKHE